MKKGHWRSLLSVSFCLSDEVRPISGLRSSWTVLSLWLQCVIISWKQSMSRSLTQTERVAGWIETRKPHLVHLLCGNYSVILNLLYLTKLHEPQVLLNLNSTCAILGSWHLEKQEEIHLNLVWPEKEKMQLLIFNCFSVCGAIIEMVPGCMQYHSSQSIVLWMEIHGAS